MLIFIYKHQKDYTKPQKEYTKTQDIRQRHRILDNDPTYLTRVATNINFTYKNKYPISKKLPILLKAYKKGIHIYKYQLNRAL